VWFDDLVVTLAPISFRNIQLAGGIFGGSSFGLVAGLNGKTPWTAELLGAAGVLATSHGVGEPVTLQWAGPNGKYTLRLTAADALTPDKIEEAWELSFTSDGQPRAYTAWVENSMRRVTPQVLPPSSPSPLEAHISLAGNESESFQLCLVAAPGATIRNVHFEVADLVSSTGHRIPAARIEWQQVGYVRVAPLRHSPANEGVFAGWWPDPLLPVTQFDLHPGFTQPVWFTIHIPSGTPAGEYAGAVQLLAKDQPSLRIPI
jgi:hypothetical protein